MDHLILWIVPALTVTVLFLGKRKLLWIAPVVSTAFSFFLDVVLVAPVTLTAVLRDHEWRAFFLLVLLIQLGVAVVLTLLAYIAAYIAAYIRRRKNEPKRS